MGTVCALGTELRPLFQQLRLLVTTRQRQWPSAQRFHSASLPSDRRHTWVKIKSWGSKIDTILILSISPGCSTDRSLRSTDITRCSTWYSSCIMSNGLTSPLCSPSLGSGADLYWATIIDSLIQQFKKNCDETYAFAVADNAGTYKQELRRRSADRVEHWSGMWELRYYFDVTLLGCRKEP